MADKIYIKSAKGGAGATTVAAGLGFALSEAGERTLIVDGDAVCASGLSVCGCNNLQVFTVADYKKGLCRAKQATIQHPVYKNLYVMPTLLCDDEQAAANAVNEVENLFDFILCDGAALTACDRAIVVTEPYLPSVKAADAALCALKDKHIKISGIIVNKVNGGLILSRNIDYPQDIAAAIGSRLTAAIPEDLMLPLGVWRQPTMRYFKCAADRVCGKNVKIPAIEDKYSGAGGYFRRKMREKI